MRALSSGILNIVVLNFNDICRWYVNKNTFVEATTMYFRGIKVKYGLRAYIMLIWKVALHAIPPIN